MATEKELRDFESILKPIARKYYRRIKKPSMYSEEDLISEGIILVLKLEKRCRRRNQLYFRNLIVRSMINRCKELVIQSYKKPISSLPKRSNKDLNVYSLVDGMTRRQLEYILFLLSPPTELVELLKGRTNKQCRILCRQYLGMTHLEDVKIENSILRQLQTA